MGVRYRLWNPSSSYVTILPEWGVKEDIQDIVSQNRNDLGVLSRYTWGTFRTWEFELKFCDQATMTFFEVNYNSCNVLEVTEGASSPVLCGVVFVGDWGPWKYSKTFQDRWDGTLLMSTY
jgi:hypothetical protein